METFSLKISEEESGALDRLAVRWDCNRPEACRRAIMGALSAPPQTADMPPTLEAKIDAIAEATLEVLRQTQAHSLASAEASKEATQWSKRGMFFGRALAEKLEVRERAILLFKEHENKEGKGA